MPRKNSNLKWRKLPGHASLRGRAGHTTTLVGRQLFVLGGRNGNVFFNDVWVFDVELEQWKQLEQKAPFAPRAYHTTTLIGDQELWMIGGSDHNTMFDDVHVLNTVTLQVFIGLIICPFNILYRSSRYAFIRTIRRIILAPFYKVVMTDFFIADQLCSQCIRRWFDEGDVGNVINAGKYLSAMLAVGTKLQYARHQTITWLSLVVVMSMLATLYQLYWDFAMDWGLLRHRCQNPWLRDELILKHKFNYFISMAFNAILRLAWLQIVLNLNLGTLDHRVTNFLLAALEVIRRGHWNFYRLENEHLNNVGKFTAVKTVPLPFRELDRV